MTVEEHYERHLAHVYSWMLGDLEQKKNDFLEFCERNHLKPGDSKVAIDLGAGNGIQSIALAERGFRVKAVDFNRQLLAELEAGSNGLPIEVINADIKTVLHYRDDLPELIVCCGDTIAHLGSVKEIRQMLADSFDTLVPNGRLVLTFRDYQQELHDTSRFIPVKSDSNKILSCFLEYFPEKVRVTDILYERENGQWRQKISSYEKVRVSQGLIENLLRENAFKVILNETVDGMVAIIAAKGS